jgi:hypothetical protein
MSLVRKVGGGSSPPTPLKAKPGKELQDALKLLYQARDEITEGHQREISLVRDLAELQNQPKEIEVKTVRVEVEKPVITEKVVEIEKPIPVPVEKIVTVDRDVVVEKPVPQLQKIYVPDTQMEAELIEAQTRLKQLEKVFRRIQSQTENRWPWVRKSRLKNWLDITLDDD